MHLHLHVDNSREGEIIALLKRNQELLIHINQKLTDMSTELKQTFLDGMARVNASLDGISQDIQTLSNGINPTGGLTEEEATEVKAKLDELATRAAAIDALTPPPTTTPEEPQS